MTVHVARIALALLVALVAAPAVRAQPVFDGDPVDPASGRPWVILPGMPLVDPGPDGRYGTADDVLDPTLIGDVDVVLRTGGTYSGGPIPPPAAGVAAAPRIVAGGRHGGSGTIVPFQLVVSNGVLPPPAGEPLLGPELDLRRGLVMAFADLDGDGVIGPTAAAAPADLEIERQEVLSFAGRAMAEMTAGVAAGELAVSMGAPASMGGLGMIVAGGVVTGVTPPGFGDGPWIATRLPFMLPLDPSQVVGGGEPGDPVDPIGIVDLELSPEGIFFPPPNHPVIGTPYALPLDGSSVSNDLLRSESGKVSGAAFGRAIDPATFVAAWGKVVRVSVDASGNRMLLEDARALTLPADGPGNTETILVYPADLVGNPTDPPPGGLGVSLEVGDGLRLVAPDTDGDPRREPLVLTSAAPIAVVVDDAGGARPNGGSDALLVLSAGAPTAVVTVAITPGDGGTFSGTLAPAEARIKRGRKADDDTLTLSAGFTLDPAALDPSSVDLTITLVAPSGTVYERTFPAGALLASRSGRAFALSDKAVKLTLKRNKRTPERHTLSLRAPRLELTAVPVDLGTLDVHLTLGPQTFDTSVACVANAKRGVTTCGP